ncbi:MAG: LemA family protein [Clostridia bacterium]|jgi:LemA protein|uniref:LemA family protein n=1 Tax=Candidatus Merdicola sp. TaxID=3085652 RepID=UPI00095CBAD9|nr:LemA family protein [Clostridia bacterium]OKZ60330.1 MAG: LemA family protein [Clostridium sp. CAG:354_28_25]
MKKSTIVIIVVVVILVAIIAGLVSNYNGVVSLSEEVDNKFATIDTMLQRRADLIPNLVNTVKGYTNQEQAVIDSVTDARAKLAGANSVGEKANADQELSTALSNLLVVVENYPDLKSSQNFINLSDELAGTENRIATARKDYNDAVKEYNTKIKRFPTNIVSGMFGYGEKEYFQASEGSEEVPTVDFNTVQ